MSDYRTSIWQYGHEGSADDVLRRLRELPHEQLARCAFNDLLNKFCGDVADYDREDPDSRNTFGKRLPYIGWYWRTVDFATKTIWIGDCGEFIGFMENNKWDHPERQLEPDETAKVIDYLWRAYRAHHAGGVVSEVWAQRDQILSELWDAMQEMEIPS